MKIKKNIFKAGALILWQRNGTLHKSIDEQYVE